MQNLELIIGLSQYEPKKLLFYVLFLEIFLSMLHLRKCCFSYLLLCDKLPQICQLKKTIINYLTFSVSQESGHCLAPPLPQGLSKRHSGMGWDEVSAQVTWKRIHFQVSLRWLEKFLFMQL